MFFWSGSASHGVRNDPPHGGGFFDRMLRSSRGDLRIHELTVSENSKFNDKKLHECGLDKRHGLLVLGAKTKSDEIEFNPAPTHVLTAGTTLIVMGAVEQIAKAKDSF